MTDILKFALVGWGLLIAVVSFVCGVIFAALMDARQEKDED